MNEEKTLQKTEQFSTELPDGAHLIDSSMGIKTYANVKAKKIISFSATTYDGKPSNKGVVNLKMSGQIVDNPPQSLCLPPCNWACIVDIDTNKEISCACMCPGKHVSGLFFDVQDNDILGPSFGNAAISEVYTKVVFEIKP